MNGKDTVWKKFRGQIVADEPPAKSHIAVFDAHIYIYYILLLFGSSKNVFFPISLEKGAADVMVLKLCGLEITTRPSASNW